MLFKEFKKQQKFKDFKEITINKIVNIRGREILILSLIEYNGKSKLWTLHKNTNNRDEDNNFGFNTNRDDLIASINNSTQHIHFSKMNIQQNEVNFTSSQCTSIQYVYGEELNVINYFIEEGVINDEWDNVDIEDMIFCSYEQSEEENFPILDMDEEIEISLQIEEEIKEKLIQHPLKLKIGKFKKNTKIYYKDYDGKENFFYIDEVVKYDIWQKTLADIDTNIENIEEEFRENYKEDFVNGLKNTCPKEMDYTAIYYENKENTQLRFLSKEYLNKKPVYNSSSTVMMWGSENKYGINGYYQYTDGLEPVEKDFKDELEVELFSKFITIPKVTITFNI